MVKQVKSKNKSRKKLPLTTKFFLKQKSRFYSVNEFQELLKHERSRADRSNTKFSLAVFSISDEKNSKKIISKFLSDLAANVRLIDHIGWIDSRSIGVLLSDTNEEGGRMFLSNLEVRLSFEIAQFPCVLYTYPEKWLDSKEDTIRKNTKEEKPSKAVNHKVESNHELVDQKEFVKLKILKENEKALDSVFSYRTPWWKRGFDILTSLFALILLSPILIIVGLFIKIVSPGPIFYKQTRVGRDGKKFTFLKFRTMKHNNNASNHASYVKDLINSETPMEKLDNGKDPRIIPGGQLLRKSCVDELPQLINVLKGDMSLVGPRPCIPYEAEEYLRWHKHRFDILPGLTGLWQVSGKNNLTFRQMIQLDINYARNVSFFSDIKIMLKTIPTVFNLLLDRKKNSNIDHGNPLNNTI
jgi:lipopolysaccharide/colanic/teichoic acid biosynthesis glycosyltransferase